jgi:DNA gyrase subunit A
MILRMVAKDVRSIGRATQGVRLLGVEEGDQVVSVARLAEREGEENGVAETAEVPPAPDTPTTPE